MTAPLVSVCVPAYNYARFLPDCIESVREQTCDDWELIICDDASTDGTAELVAGYAGTDPRIRLVANGRRLGMNANLKRAADAGQGRFLKILCADDWLAPRCLETMCALLDRHPNVVLGTSAEIHCDANGRPLRVQFLFGRAVSIVSGEAMLDRMARGEGFGGNSSFFIRTTAYRQAGGYGADVLYSADYDLAARLCRAGDYLHSDEPLFYGRRHPDASSVQDPKRLVDVMDRFRIPERVFRPRQFGNREWRRYQRLSAQITAQCVLNVGLEYARGHVEYARGLRAVVADHGNFLLGLPLLALHVPTRLLRRLTGRHVPAGTPPQAWMGAPAARRAAIDSSMERACEP